MAFDEPLFLFLAHFLFAYLTLSILCEKSFFIVGKTYSYSFPVRSNEQANTESVAVGDDLVKLLAIVIQIKRRHFQNGRANNDRNQTKPLHCSIPTINECLNI